MVGCHENYELIWGLQGAADAKTKSNKTLPVMSSLLYDFGLGFKLLKLKSLVALGAGRQTCIILMQKGVVIFFVLVGRGIQETQEFKCLAEAVA